MAQICFKAVNFHSYIHSFETVCVCFISIIHHFIRSAKTALCSWVSTLTGIYALGQTMSLLWSKSFVWCTKVSLKHQVCTLASGYFSIYMEYFIFTSELQLRTLCINEKRLWFKHSSWVKNPASPHSRWPWAISLTFWDSVSSGVNTMLFSLDFC